MILATKVDELWRKIIKPRRMVGIVDLSSWKLLNRCHAWKNLKFILENSVYRSHRGWSVLPYVILLKAKERKKAREEKKERKREAERERRYAARVQMILLYKREREKEREKKQERFHDISHLLAVWLLQGENGRKETSRSIIRIDSALGTLTEFHWPGWRRQSVSPIMQPCRNVTTITTDRWESGAPISDGNWKSRGGKKFSSLINIHHVLFLDAWSGNLFFISHFGENC